MGGRLGLTLLACAVVAAATISRAGFAMLGGADTGTSAQSFDWVHGDGTSGWTPATSSAQTGFHFENDLKLLPGLVIWRVNGNAGAGDWAEWTYAAPGASSIDSASLSFAYAAIGLEHACIVAGIRSVSGTLDSQSRCRPLSAGTTNWTFHAPASGSGKTVFFRIEIVCQKSEARTCARRDTFGPLAFARLSSASVVLHDRTAPQLTAAGLVGGVTRTAAPVSVRLTAADDGTGVQRVWLSRDGNEVASQSGNCDPHHRNASLQGRPCATTAQLQASVSFAGAPDGPVELAGHAIDAAGNVASTETVSVLIDRTPPTVLATGPLADDGSTGSVDPVGVTLEASDADAAGSGSGVRRVWLTDETGNEVAQADGTCDSGRCELGLSADLEVDISSLDDGTHTFVAHSEDAAGNVADGEPFDLSVDRTPPPPVENLRVAEFGDDTGDAVIRWDEPADSAGISGYRYRYSFDGDTWSEPSLSPVPEFTLPDVALGDDVDVEVTALDGAGNESDTASTTLTIFESSEPKPGYDSPDPDPGTTVELTSQQSASAEQIARADPRVRKLLAGRAATANSIEPLSVPSGGVIGANLELGWTGPVTLETDWPDISWSGDGYTTQSLHYSASGVTGLDLIVDLRTRAVVSIQPDDAAVIGSIAGQSGAGALRLATTAAAKSHNPEGSKSPSHTINVHVINGSVVPGLGEDLFVNWSYHQPVQDETKGDWPIDLLFIGNADVNKAKSVYPGPHPILLATPQWAEVMDSPPNTLKNMVWLGGGTNGLWDSDRGAYKGEPCLGHKWHFRVFATGPGMMYSPSMGYYVIGASHQDHHDDVPGKFGGECPHDWYGGSERAEQEIAKDAAHHSGWWVAPDYVDLLNPDHREWITNRLYDNNGLATVIGIDTPNDPSVVKKKPPVRRAQNAVAPSISGLAVVADTLSADQGVWTFPDDDSPAFSYGWQRCGSDGTGCSTVATGPDANYTVSDDDVGSTLRVVVTAKNGGGLIARRSTPTDVVPPTGPQTHSFQLTVSTQQGLVEFSPCGTSCNVQVLVDHGDGAGFTPASGTQTLGRTRQVVPVDACPAYDASEFYGSTCTYNVEGAVAFQLRSVLPVFWNAGKDTPNICAEDQTGTVCSVQLETLGPSWSPDGPFGFKAYTPQSYWGDPPSNIAPPTVSGTSFLAPGGDICPNGCVSVPVGGVLTLSQGVWANAVSYEVGWWTCGLFGCGLIDGAHGFTHVVTPTDCRPDHDTSLTCQSSIYAVVTAQNAAGIAQASVPLDPVLGVVPVVVTWN